MVSIRWWVSWGRKSIESGRASNQKSSAEMSLEQRSKPGTNFSGTEMALGAGSSVPVRAVRSHPLHPHSGRLC